MRFLKKGCAVLDGDFANEAQQKTRPSPLAIERKGRVKLASYD
jgi:hypothetical protein